MIKMKTRIVTGIFMLLGWTLSAQEETIDWGTDSLECRRNISLYNEPLKQGNYTEALKYWRKAMDVCPKYGSSLYINGIFLYNKMYDKTKDETRQDEIADTIIMLYEKKAEFFGTDNDWQGKYGSAVMDLKKDEYKKAFEILKPVIDEVENQKSYTVVYRFYLSLYYGFAKAKEKEEQDEFRTYLIDYYSIANERLDAVLKNGGNKKGVDQVRGVVEKYFLKAAKECSDVLPIIKKKTEALPEDKEAKVEEIKGMMDILEKTDCQDSEEYGGLLDMLIELNPSADAAYRAAEYNRKQGNGSKSIEYYNKAIDLEGDGQNADKYKLGLVKGYFDANTYKSVVRAAKSVGGEHRGEALKLAGIAIGSTTTQCGDTYYDRKVNYCLAVDYLNKAAANGASGTSSYITRYKDNFPTLDEAFKVGTKEGETITLPCWNETTKLRLK